jgi:SAM-dependent methyltransferase
MSHVNIYNRPDLYARGAGHKKVSLESLAIQEIVEKFGPPKSKRSLELFAGPALNSEVLAKAGFEAHCVDSNPNMFEFATKRNPNSLHYHLADVTSFKIDKKFDFAFSLFDSVAYLLTNEQFIKHLRQVAMHLNKGGLYIIEMGHPKCYFSKEGWISEHHDQNGNDEVKLIWGDAYDHLDPINLILNCTVTVDAEVKGEKVTIVDNALQRIYLFNEIKLLVAQVRAFEIVHWEANLSECFKLFKRSKYSTA